MRSRIRRLAIGAAFFLFLALSNVVAFQDWKVPFLGIQDADAIVFLCTKTLVVCGNGGSHWDCRSPAISGGILCPCHTIGC